MSTLVLKSIETILRRAWVQMRNDYVGEVVEVVGVGGRQVGHGRMTRQGVTSVALETLVID